MIKRFGHVVGWFGNIVAILFVLAGVTSYFQLYQRILGRLSGHEYLYDPVMVAQLDFLVKNNVQRVEDLSGDALRNYRWAETAAREAEIEKMMFLIVTGVVIFFAGRALRYIIAGRY